MRIKWECHGYHIVMKCCVLYAVVWCPVVKYSFMQWGAGGYVRVSTRYVQTVHDIFIKFAPLLFLFLSLLFFLLHIHTYINSLSLSLYSRTCAHSLSATDIDRVYEWCMEARLVRDPSQEVRTNTTIPYSTAPYRTVLYTVQYLVRSLWRYSSTGLIIQ